MRKTGSPLDSSYSVLENPFRVCTTYGTKLISPFNDHLFSLNSIHVFEPIYTSILLIGVGLHLFRSKKKEIKHRILSYALGISTCYLVVGLVSKNHAFYHFRTQVIDSGMAYEDILVSPTPMNIFLWHGIVKQEDGYQFGTYSIFDDRDHIDFHFVESANDVIPEIEGNRLIKYYGYQLISKSPHIFRLI